MYILSFKSELIRYYLPPIIFITLRYYTCSKLWIASPNSIAKWGNTHFNYQMYFAIIEKFKVVVMMNIRNVVAFAFKGSKNKLSYLLDTSSSNFEHEFLTNYGFKQRQFFRIPIFKRSKTCLCYFRSWCNLFVCKYFAQNDDYAIKFKGIFCNAISSIVLAINTRGF